jgi:hypothetical protein
MIPKFNFQALMDGQMTRIGKHKVAFPKQKQATIYNILIIQFIFTTK